MPALNPNPALEELETLKRRFGESDVKILRTLKSLAKSTFDDADSLIRFHDALLLFRAYPPSVRVLKQVEQSLKSFARRVRRLNDLDVDLSPFDDPEVSGVAEGSVTSNFSYPMVRWLVSRYPNQIAIDWDWFEEEDRFGATMPRFLPVLEEDAMVEAHVPYRRWLQAARGRKNEVVWLVERFESLKISDKARAESYDSLRIHVTWRFGLRSSRTGMKLPMRQVFYHRRPLIQRREILLATELTSSRIPIERVSRVAAQRIVEMARETSAVRYRELHGFTHGDARRVLRADLGRGTEAYLMGVPAENRLPLRAYHAAMIFKNGVPVGYFEGLSLFERIESGFNLYYTFRDGETAWLYARILRLMRQVLGVTVFSIDPYQVGHENEEGIESGAFWFYRKLGFRPVQPELLKLTLAEEARIISRPGYRTSARMLRKLASGPMLFEMPGESTGKWDRFEVRNIGLAIQRRMAADFDGDAQTMRAKSLAFAERALNVSLKPGSSSLENFALVLGLIPNVLNWPDEEKQLAARIMQAKSAGDEALYLHLMQKHSTLRKGMIQLGSSKSG